jgi:hypothetical protein
VLPWLRGLSSESAELFGYSASGLLFFALGERVRLVETQEHATWDVSANPAMFVEQLTTAEVRKTLLREVLFQTLRGTHAPLDRWQLLAPVPALPLGGSWAREQFRPISFEVYLSMMAQVMLEHS